MMTLSVSCGLQGNKEGKTQDTVAAPDNAGGNADRFPYPDIPLMLSSPDERKAYLLRHYWDEFDFADTTLVNNRELIGKAFVNCISMLADETISEKELAGLLKHFHVDGAAARFDQADRIRRVALADGIRIPEDLQLITGCSYYDWNPTRTAKPFQTIISLLMKQLWNEIEHRQSSLQERSLDWEIIPGTSTKERKTE